MYLEQWDASPDPIKQKGFNRRTHNAEHCFIIAQGGGVVHPQ